MHEHHGVVTVARRDRTRSLPYTVRKHDGLWQLTIAGPTGDDETYSGGDLFDALWAAREDWERAGGRILVQGSRSEAWPSGMDREHGAWSVAIHDLDRLRAGATLDVVDTLAPADATICGSTAEHRAYRERAVEAMTR